MNKNIEDSKGLTLILIVVFIGLMAFLGSALKLWADTQLEVISQPQFEIDAAVKGK